MANADDLPPPAANADSTLGDRTAAAAGTGGNSPASWQGKRVGNFRILGFLGRGAMGRVFRAEDLRLKRHVALKIFPTVLDQGKRKVRLERFLREARSTAALDHPGIVKIFESDEFRGWYYIAMELVEGGPVSRLVEANGPFDAARAGQIGAEVGEALEFAHDHGIIHRDVKPDNVLLARGGRAKLVDFGLAFTADPNDSNHLIDEAVGTAFFMAPELCRGHGASPQSDQYALAGTVFYLLTGAPPYTGTTRDAILRQHLDAPVPNLRKLRPDLPQGLTRAVERGLAKNPEDRFQTCDQFAKVLRVYTINASPAASGSSSAIAIPPIVESSPAPRSSTPFWKTKPTIYAGIGVAVLATAALAAILATRGRPPESASAPPATATPTTLTPVAKPTPARPAVVVTPPAADPSTPTTRGDAFLFAGFADNSRGPFDYALTGSGSTVGILPASSNLLTRDDQRGLVQQLKIIDDPAKSTLPDGSDGWFVRHISGQHGSRKENAPRPTTGWVGLWIRTSAPGLKVGLAIDNTADVTADRAIRQAVVADGRWHCYEWNLQDKRVWEKWLGGDGIIDTPDFTLDSILFWGPNADATILIDDVSHNPTGRLAPVDLAVQSAVPGT